MNKQQMIDKAIDTLSGDFDKSFAGSDSIRDYLWLVDEIDFQRLTSSNEGFSGQYICTRKEFEDRVGELSNMKEWNGEGLPLVGAYIEIKEVDGVEFQYNTKSFLGELCKVMANFKNYNNTDMVAVQKGDGECACFILKVCKPIQSDRDKVLEYVDDKWREHNGGVSGSQAREFFAILYDTEMLKLPDTL